MEENNLTASNSSESAMTRLQNTVDATTRARIGALSARNITDSQIADILMLSVEQVIAVHLTDEFKKKFSEVAEQVIQDQIDRDEGWDAIETKALEQVLETLTYNRDPKFALAAARMANQAERNKNINKSPHVIDSAKQTNNVIILSMNKTYINVAGQEGVGTGQPRVIDQPRKRSDLPSPKQVEQLLAPVSQEKIIPKSELELEFDRTGVVFPHDD